jgi:hypothetical protein
MFNQQLWLFMVTAVLCYGFAGIGLKYLLGPLKKLEDQVAVGVDGAQGYWLGKPEDPI